MKGKITPKQEAFCREYLVDLNATQAAIRAGYSAKTASEQSARLLGNVRVSATLQKLMDARAKKLEIKSEDVLEELKRLGHSDIRQIYDDKGAVLQPKDWPEEIARAVSSIEVKEEYEAVPEGVVCDDCGKLLFRILVGFTKKVKFWDKPKALELMGKHKKLFTDVHEHKGTFTLEDLAAGSKDGEGTA